MGAPERDIAQAKDFIAPPGYSRHRPEATLLYRLVANNRRQLSRWLGLTACYYEPSIWQPDGGDTTTKQTD
jgi:hypothetical protein